MKAFLKHLCFSMISVFSVTALATTDLYAHISSSKRDIENAQCWHEVSLNPDLVLNQLSEINAKSSHADFAPGGIVLKNESEILAQSLKQLTSYVDYSTKPYMGIELWKQLPKGKCGTALCLSEELFGAELGPIYLTVMSKLGVSLSHLGYDRLQPPLFIGETTPSEQTLSRFNAIYKIKAWDLEDLKIYLNGILNLPDFFYPLPYTRMLKSSHTHWNGEGVHSNAVITLYPSIEAKESSYKVYTIVHEIGHVLGSAMGVDGDREWIDISWALNTNTNTVKARPDAHFVSTYAKKDFFEDFAESFAAYRFNPKKLKKTSLKKYEYLKNKIFKGFEYINEDHCPSPAGKDL